MIFTETRLKGAFIVERQPFHDERGYFSRTFCVDEFKNAGLDTAIYQSNISFNPRQGTLRGMHYQLAPHEEIKLVSCLRGAIFDVIIDLRPTSSTYKEWFSIILSAANHIMLYIPQGFAHGFLTLERESLVHYNMSKPYTPDLSSGLRYNDPAFNIIWPEAPKVISEKDRSYKDYIK